VKSLSLRQKLIMDMIQSNVDKKFTL